MSITQRIVGQNFLTKVSLPIGALVAALMVGSCSEPVEAKREYKVPASLCGKKVPPEVLAPLLPPGKRVSSSSTGEGDPLEYCRLKVDGEQVLSLSVEWRGEGTGLREAANTVVGLRERDEVGLGGEGEEVTEEPPYLYSRIGAVAKVSCKNPRMTDMNLFVSARVDTEETPKAAEMKNLIASYERAVGESDECT